MKNLLYLFRGIATRKNTLSLSAVRMQAIGALGVYLQHTFDTPVTFTQMDIAVTPVEKDAAGVHCDAMIEAFFYTEQTEKRYGREGGPVPIPPKVVSKIRFRADDGQVLRWETFRMEVEILIEGTRSSWCENAMESQLAHGWKIEEFDEKFNAHRPWGRPILTGNHDQVVWTVGGPGR